MLSLVVAVDKNWGIAKNGGIPWNSPTDREHFVKLTKTTVFPHKQNIVIMGRKTWDTLPRKPLKDRINIVISRTLKDIENVHIVKDMDDAVALSLKLYLSSVAENVFVIGGVEVYREALLKTVLLNKVYVTQIHDNYDCDLQFPAALLYKQCHNDVTHERVVLEEVGVTKKRKHSESQLTFMEFTSKQNYTGEEQYLKLVYDILTTGDFRKTRNANTRSLFTEHTLVFDVNKEFPLLTTRKMSVKGIWEELLFFMNGETNTKKLSSVGVKVWEQNTSKTFLEQNKLPYEEGDMGPMYGYNLKHFGATYKGMNKNYEGQGFDQIAQVIETIKKDPYSRRIIMTTFNPATAQEGVLYPCHGIVIQFYVSGMNNLDCHMYQRSADMLGLSWNIPSYALLIYLMVIVINNDPDYKNKLKPGKLIISLGDAHIYENSFDNFKTQLSRTPLGMPKLEINHAASDFKSFKWEHVGLKDYKCHAPIKFEMVA